MNPVSGTILFTLLVVVSFAPRRWALLAMMGGVFFLTQGNTIDVVGLNIYPVRFLEAFALTRVIVRGELVPSRLTRLDWMLLLLYNYVAVVWILRSSDVAPQQFASALDPTLCYLGFRGLMKTAEDIRWLLYAMVGVLLPYTGLVFLERLTGHSAFTMVGSIPTLEFRNGVPRCMGSFRHSILLGTVAASFVPLYIGLCLSSRRRAVPALAGSLCLVLVLLSNAGGPLTSAATAFGGWALWRIRRKMRLVRWSILGVLFLCLVFMKAPIWYLPFKISQITGGGGYHRGLLMEMAWRDLHKWSLFGMDIRETADWFPYVHVFAPDVGGADITNQFVVFGIKAGLAGVALAVAVLTFAFKGIGRALMAVRFRGGNAARANELLLWSLGVTLVVHTVSWLGISYFDQSWVVWLMHLAAASTAIQVLHARRARWTRFVRLEQGDATEAEGVQPAAFGAAGGVSPGRVWRIEG